MNGISYSSAAKLNQLFNQNSICMVCGRTKTELIHLDEGPFLTKDLKEDHTILQIKAIVCKYQHGTILATLAQRYRCLDYYPEGGIFTNRFTGAAHDRLTHETVINIDTLAGEIVIYNLDKKEEIKQWIINNAHSAHEFYFYEKTINQVYQ